MKTVNEQIEALERTILSFEKHIQDTNVTKTTLDKAQAHLDEIEKQNPATASTDGRMLARMYEFQVLIDYARGDLKRARDFITEARRANQGNDFVSETVAHLAGMDPTVNNQGGATIPFFMPSAVRFIVMNILTLGLYTTYWFYKNWRAVEEGTGRRQLALLSAIFASLVSYNLFIDIKQAAEANGYDRPFSPGWRAFWVFVVGPLALIGINYPMETAGGERPRELSVGEVILLLLGILYWGLVIISSAAEPDYNDYNYSNYNQIDSTYSDYSY